MSGSRLLLAEHKTPTSRPMYENSLKFELAGETIVVSAYTLWDANDGEWDSYAAVIPIQELRAVIDRVLVHTAAQRESFEVRSPDNLTSGFPWLDSVKFNRTGNNLTLDISERSNSIVGLTFPLEKLQVVQQALEQARAA